MMDRDTTVFTVALIMLILATVFTALRLVSKWGVMKKTSADDWLVLVAWVLNVALTVSVMVGSKVGLGKQDHEILPEWREPLKRCIYAFTIFYNPALMCMKSAILVLYLRLAAAHPFLKIASYVVLGIVNVAGLVLTFLNIFQCRPISAAFSLKDGTCIDIVSLYLSSAPITFLTDLAILLLPLPILTGLRMEFRQKVILVATFFVGGFSTIVDVIRLVYLQNTLEYERAYESSSTVTATNIPPNFTYEASFTLMWSCVEVTTGLVCACVLVLKPLVLRVLPAMIHHSTEGQRTHQGTVGGRDVNVNAKAPTSPRSPVNRLAPVFETSALEEEDEDDGEGGGGMDFMQMLAMTDPPAQTQGGGGGGVGLGLGPSATLTDVSVSQGHTITLDSPSAPSTISRARRLSRRLTLTKSNLFAHTQVDIATPQQQPHQTFFDFVNMGSKKPLTALNEREAWWPVLFVSILFFLWGFAYGLLGTLNGQIQGLLNYSASRTVALHSAYWLGYLFGPPAVGYWTLTRSSFKSTFIAGLCLYACGAMSFWPSSVLLSYPGFFISNFIIASGLSCLEMSSQPFIALAGPPHLAEARLLFAQGIQAIGSVISPILAKEVLFSTLNNGINQRDLFNVQWCYLGVALFVIMLAVIFYYVPLPEASDDELEAHAQQTLINNGLDIDSTIPILGLRLSARKVLYIMGTYMVFLYCGAQETNSYFFNSIITDLRPASLSSFWLQAIGHSVFALGRFLASYFCWMGITPRVILLISVIGSFLTTLLCLVLPKSSSRFALACFLLTIFFESPIIPLVNAISWRNQGKALKYTAAVLVMAISGGGALPVISYGAEMVHRSNPKYPLVITTVLWAGQLIMPIWLFGGMRKWVDPMPGNRSGWALLKRTISGARSGKHNPEGRRASMDTPETSITAVGSQYEGKGGEYSQHVEKVQNRQ